METKPHRNVGSERANSRPSSAHTSKPIQLASLGSRLVARLVDQAIALVILIPNASEAASELTQLLSAIGFMAYFLFSDSFGSGQSLGKRLLHIAVIDEKTGKYCTIGKSFVRNLSLVCLWLLDLLLIFRKERQRLGDIVARTMVVKCQPLLPVVKATKPL
jgi:uncharacterized RDD family membrane protein YckC